MDEMTTFQFPSWVSEARNEIEFVVWEYQTLHTQFAGENRDKGQAKFAPEPADLIHAARKAAAAMRMLSDFNITFMSARQGWDRSQVDRLNAVSDLHCAVLGAIVENVVPMGLAKWSHDDLAAVMPTVDARSAIGFRDPFRSGFDRGARNIENIVAAFEGVLGGTRPTNNRQDRLIGKLGDIWRRMEGVEPKGGSKAGAQPWPFEHFAMAVWQQMGEKPPTGRTIKAALARWNPISTEK